MSEKTLVYQEGYESEKMAEMVRFELTVPANRYDALARRSLRPLGHISAMKTKLFKSLEKDTNSKWCEMQDVVQSYLNIHRALSA